MNFGLTGSKLGHSMSKIIHTKLFKLKNLEYNYELYPDESLNNVFDNTLSKLDGFNVTIPYKTEIIDFLDEADDKVKLYNSCNTVVKRDGKFYGYNTDVYGFLNSLKRCDVDLNNKRILVLGSGGVSRMMAFESVLKGGIVYITSRNQKKCLDVYEEIYKKLGKQIHIISFEDIDNNFDIVLNGTPCGMYPDVVDLPIPFSKIKKVPFVFDTVYNPRETLLTIMAKYCGNNAENGGFMLAEQAAVAQTHFCGLKYSFEEVEGVADSINISPIDINKNIVLIGPPGSGKTTIGRELAKIFNLRLVDLDSQIEQRHGNITDIFGTRGEGYFRQLESEILLEFSQGKNQLISTGGGIVETEAAMKKICKDKNNIVVLINPSFDVLLTRVSRTDKRPLLRGDAGKKLQALLEKRLPLYEKYCNVRLDIKAEQHIKNTAVQCVDKIVEYIKTL